MEITIKRLGLLATAFAMALLFSACEEALTDSTGKLNPVEGEGEGTPFVEFVSSENPVATAGGSVTLTVEPGTAIGEPITVQYNASGPALGQVMPANSVTIPFDTSTTSLDDADITVELAEDSAPGDTVRVELTGASTESGQTVEVGRGGTSVDRSRTITVVEK